MNTLPTIAAASFKQFPAKGDTDEYRIRRIAGEFYQRSQWGAFLNAISFLLISFTARYDRISWWIVVIPAAVFIAFGWFRYHHRPPGPSANHRDYRRWVWTHWVLIHVGLILWGTIVAAVNWRQAGPDTATMVAAICTIAHATAVGHAFAMHPAHARFSITAVMGPSTLVFFFLGISMWPIGAVLLIYFGYLMGALARSAKAFDNQISMEIDLMNQRQEIAHLSMSDPLTGLPNRRSYEVVWAQLWQAALRSGAPLALLVLDLDHFKRINDTFGHLAGDDCLRHFAGLLGQALSRKSDYIARIGGEEFVVILPNTLVATAKAKAEALMQTLAANPCRHEDAEIAVTVSIGVGMIDINVDTDPDSTFVRVDHACYEAKLAGRNCLVTT